MAIRQLADRIILVAVIPELNSGQALMRIRDRL
jgi:hypothetical protein